MLGKLLQRESRLLLDLRQFRDDLFVIHCRFLSTPRTLILQRWVKLPSRRRSEARVTVLRQCAA